MSVTTHLAAHGLSSSGLGFPRVCRTPECASPPGILVRVVHHMRNGVAGDGDQAQPAQGLVHRDGISSADTRETTLAELARCRQEWNAVDERIGYTRAKAGEDAAAAIEQRFAVELCSHPATSAIAVAAKLHCIVSQGEPGPDNSEFPWPQLRVVLDDLLLIGAAKPSTTLNH
ncbi:MAG: hypothetical protein EOO38_07705 [Cytophagaceae bacterium]|nr:MAG: hypothetical protein EOO38_07705 [Cytophagaceae bacterium]